MKYLIALALTLSALVVVPFASGNHAWNDYHWARSSNPFQVNLIDQTTTADWHSRLQVAASDWSVSTMLDASVSNGSRPVTVENADYGSTGWVGLASIWIDNSHHIIQGSVQLNEYYLNQSAYSTWRQYV